MNYSNKQEGKNTIKLLMIIVVVLLILAIAVIGYLFSRMSAMEHAAQTQTGAPVSRTLSPQATPQKVREAVSTARQAAAPSAKLASQDIATIVQLVMTQMQKSQQKTASPQPVAIPASSEKTQTAHKEEAAQAPAQTAKNSDAEDLSGTLENVINVLENADVDTVEEKQDNLPEETAQSMSKAKARQPAPQRAKDNFNKVVVDDQQTDDLAQLTTEIDQLVQEEIVSPTEKKYDSTVKKEIEERQNEMRTIVVEEGDSLMSIAVRAYHDASQYTKILKANPGIIKNPDRIFVGQVLRVPE